MLRNLDIIYPSLYDFFNQNYTYSGINNNRKYTRISIDMIK